MKKLSKIILKLEKLVMRNTWDIIKRALWLWFVLPIFLYAILGGWVCGKTVDISDTVQESIGQNPGTNPITSSNWEAWTVICLILGGLVLLLLFVQFIRFLHNNDN